MGIYDVLVPECPDCADRYTDRGNGKCGTCEGTGIGHFWNATIGMLAGSDEEGKCEDCNGTGICSTCEGTGKLY